MCIILVSCIFYYYKNFNSLFFIILLVSISNIIGIYEKGFKNIVFVLYLNFLVKS